MLEATNVVQPDGTSVTTEFLPTGQLKKTYGSRTYPVEYTYDYAGRMQTMKTWQDFAGDSGAATTTWNYDPARGWLAGKRYADATGPDYTCTPAGRLLTRTWARGLTTTYGYDNAGLLATVAYSDSTPGVTCTYDRLGRQATLVRNGMTTTLSYNTAGQLLGESYSGGTLSGLALTNLAVQHSTTPLLQHSV
jgi:YD repeat-containing protein